MYIFGASGFGVGAIKKFLLKPQPDRNYLRELELEFEKSYLPESEPKNKLFSGAEAGSKFDNFKPEPRSELRAKLRFAPELFRV